MPEEWIGVNCWQCPVCGSLVPCEDANPDDNDQIECEECGFVGGY